MRHFALALRARGWQVHYVAFDAADNSGTIVGELQRWRQSLGATQIHVTECGEWRLEQALRDAQLPLVWHRDTRFLCSREAFARWAQGRSGLRMEHFYRGCANAAACSWSQTAAPLEALGISMVTIASHCHEDCAGRFQPTSSRTPSLRRSWPWFANTSATITAPWTASTTP